jgi:hypothetical protein
MPSRAQQRSKGRPKKDFDVTYIDTPVSAFKRNCAELLTTPPYILESIAVLIVLAGLAVLR